MVYRFSGIEKILDDYNEIFDPPHSTITPTKKEANVPNVNTLPGEDVFYLDCRILPETGIDRLYPEIDKIIGEICRKYDVTITYEHVQKTVSGATPADCLLVNKLQETVREVYSTETKLVGIGGGTVAAYLRNEGIDAVVWVKLTNCPYAE